MNGRVYDYNLGRFMSVDPFIQSPTSTQSVNPYSYIMNNPLAGTDPTGYCATTDNVQDCADSIESGKTQDITNKDGKTVGTIGKDSKGNIYVTKSNGANAHSAIQGAMSQLFDIGGMKQIAQNGPTSVQGRSVSQSDKNGDIHNWTVNDNIDSTTSEGAWDLIQGKQNQGQGYQNWAEAGGDRSGSSHPLVAMGTILAPTGWLGRFTNWAKGIFSIRSGVNATVATEKFSAYIFKDGATHGKDVIFKGLGYSVEQSAQLAKIYQAQATKLYSQGKFVAGEVTPYGQRIEIGIRLQGIGSAADKSAYIKSGWMLRNDGSISLSTPLSGFVR